MLRHKKLLALILGGVMTTSVMLTGCGSSDKKQREERQVRSQLT